jgi:uncharacterized SAM-binding protein YcdF (DUF218 family)
MWRRARKWCWNGSAAFGLFYLFVTITPLTRWWTEALAGRWDGPEGDVLVVLTGSDLGDVLGESSYWRAVYTVRAMRSVRYRKVIISGNAGAEKIREFAAGHGLDVRDVEVESRSRDTHENVLMTIPLIPRGASRVVLLTSDYHVTRSALAFRKGGIEVRRFPIPDGLKRYGFMSRRWIVFLDLCLESAKLVYYQAQGWI